MPTCRIIGKKSLGKVNFTDPPPKASCCTTNCAASENVNLQRRVLICGRAWSGSLSLCHGRCIPMVPADLDPLFIASFPVVSTPCCKEAHTCVHLLYRRYHLIDSSIHLSIVFVDLTFSDIFLVFTAFVFAFSTCRKVVPVLCVRVLSV